MTQAALGDAAGLPGTSISHFESGARKPSFENLRRLADKLSVSVDYLMGRVDEPGEVMPDELASHASKLTAADRALAVDFVQMLAKRRAAGG
jgi:transcriptional regulator with XRE-family HTH domain